MLTQEQRTAIIESIYKVDDKGIYGFFKEHRFLSNFHLCEITYEGLIYNSTEAAYQAAKTLDPNMRERFIANDWSPSKAKAAGQLLKLREDWDSVKLEIMYELNMIKYTRHPELRKQLLSTGDKYLEETNYWGDTYWGMCKGKGENNLGKTLMRIRNDLRL